MAILSLYTNSLRKHPRITNSITTGFLFGSGDIIAQVLDTSPSKYDIRRTLRAVIYGSLIFSFVGDRWYRFLSTIKFPGPPLSNPRLNNMRTGILKMSIDQLGFAPIGIPLYYSIMSILENRTIEGIDQKLKDNWLPTLQANWMVWPVFQVFNLSLIPVQHQLLCVNVVSIFWNTYLSMRNAKKGDADQIPVHSPPVPE